MIMFYGVSWLELHIYATYIYMATENELLNVSGFFSYRSLPI